MTSTEFTVGLGEGARISSKVLKPPGGGSSDIFGLGNSHAQARSNVENGTVNATTHSRLFGNNQTTNNQPETKSVNQIPETNQKPSSRAKKVYVRRNPITGEEIEINLDPENEDKNDCDNKDDNDKDNNKDDKEEEAAPVPSKSIQTSIRVRNPPGGKSSGIF